MRIRSQKGFTLIELLIVVAIIGIIAAIAVPGLLRARISGNEASAIGSMRSINSSQQAFASACASGFYAQGLGQLAMGPNGVNGRGAPFISPDLGQDDTGATVATGASNLKSGYEINLAEGDGAAVGDRDACNGELAADLRAAYIAWADPANPGTTGSRYFWTNTLGTLYWHTEEEGTLSGAINGQQGGTEQVATAEVLQ